MGYKLLQVKEDEGFEPLFVAFREGFTNPGNALWPLFMGDWQPDNPAAREAALQEATDRLRSWHRADPTSTWLEVIDEDTGEVAAGGRWSIYKRGAGNPYDGHGPIETAWFPEGDSRKISTKLLNDFLATSAKHMNRPHAFINILFTAPNHRRKGCASLVMDWGVDQAKHEGLDLYVEATNEGKALYEKYGFKAVEESHFEVDETDSTLTGDPETRKAVVKVLTPFTWWSMVKPAPQ